MDMQKRKVGRPKGVKGKPKEKPESKVSVDKLLNAPKTMPIEEHPYLFFLAGKWETLEDQIDGLKKEQAELVQVADDFRKTYPGN